ncbi:MAG: hypothetical protein WDN69_30680 [Aliidongia sp.]
MIATARSIAWLFRYELKLQWRSFGRRRSTSLVVGAMLGGWQLLALLLAFGIDRADLPACRRP